MTNHEIFVSQDSPSSHEPREEDPTVARIQAEMEKILPDYSVVDRSRWDGYNPEEDPNDNGRLLSFFKGEKSPNTPEVMFIFKKEGGYAINVYRNPLGMGSKTHLAVNGGTIYKDLAYGEGGFWTMEDLPQAIEAARINREGIPLIPEVIDQQTFIMRDNSFVTLRELVDSSRQYRQDYEKENKEAKKRKETIEEIRLRGEAFKQRILEFRPRDIYQLFEENPQLVYRLVKERLLYQAGHNIPFLMEGREYSPKELIAEVERESDIGKRVALLEVIKIGTYLEILWETHIIS